MGTQIQREGREGQEGEQAGACNEVRLVGRVGAAPAERTLPSGDRVVTFRVVVERPESAVRARAPRVDTIDCAAWRADVRRTVLRWQAGDVVSVTGALRRRFWRGPGGPASRSEVEVAMARRLRTS